MSEFKYELKKHVATLSEDDKGYSVQVNVISYNGRTPKMDIRTWKDGRMLKGICLNADETSALIEALDGFSKDDLA